jgi:hypothetical protein
MGMKVSTEQKNEIKIAKRKSNISAGGDEPPDDKRQRWEIV